MRKKNLKQVPQLVILFGLLVLCLSACQCKHEWQEATCTTPKTCALCGETEGEPRNHEWQEATCTIPKTCILCGLTEGEPRDHEWQEATCTTPKTCTLCGETEGKEMGHLWKNATCAAPKTCSRCGETTGQKSNKHSTRQGYCTVCGKFINELSSVANSIYSDIIDCAALMNNATTTYSITYALDYVGEYQTILLHAFETLNKYPNEFTELRNVLETIANEQHDYLERASKASTISMQEYYLKQYILAFTNRYTSLGIAMAKYIKRS